MTFFSSPVPGPLHALPASAFMARRTITARRTQHSAARVREVALAFDLVDALTSVMEASVRADRDAPLFPRLGAEAELRRWDGRRHRTAKLPSNGGGRRG